MGSKFSRKIVQLSALKRQQGNSTPITYKSFLTKTVWTEQLSKEFKMKQSLVENSHAQNHLILLFWASKSCLFSSGFVWTQPKLMLLTAVSVELSKTFPETQDRKGIGEKRTVNGSFLQFWLLFEMAMVFPLCKITFKNRILYLQMIWGSSPAVLFIYAPNLFQECFCFIFTAAKC